MSRSLLAVLLLAAGCAYGGPGTTPSPAAPSPSAAPTAVPTAPPLTTPAPSPTVAPSSNDSCDPDYDYGCYPTAAPTTAVNGLIVETAESAVNGTYLVGSGGLALYTNANDTAEHSSCTGGCTEGWPPLMVDGPISGGAGVSGTFGSLGSQVTYNGRPLYYFAGDSAPGDTSGEGMGGVWHLAQP